MKRINILGKNIPILAILVAMLVIGTASAAVYSYYATLEGTATVTTPILITVGDGIPVSLGGTGSLVFTDNSGTFSVTNNGDENVVILLTETVTQAAPTDPAAPGEITYSVSGGGTIDGNTLTVTPEGIVTVTVEVSSTAPIVDAELYNVIVTLNPLP